MSLRRVFLESPSEGNPPLLAEGEDHHARKVLRVRAGDELLGLDGVGGAWPLRVTAVASRELALEWSGAPERSPAPTRGLELAAPIPKGGRAEEMLDRLTQLGLTRWLPTWCDRTQKLERELTDKRRSRLERVARESCKQSGRLWLPEVLEPAGLADRLTGAELVALDPTGEEPLLSFEPASDRVRVVIGPEGGFTETELATLRGAGARVVRLEGSILRLETAAEFACGLLAQKLADEENAAPGS